MNIGKDGVEWIEDRVKEDVHQWEARLKRAEDACKGAYLCRNIGKDGKINYDNACRLYKAVENEKPDSRMSRRKYRQEYVDLIIDSEQDTRCPDRGIPSIVSQAWGDK